MDLFEQHYRQVIEQEAPLAARMRPRTLDEFVGQGAIVGPGRLLRRAIQADQLSSLIFYGPPGTGKTTLARVIANTTRAHFIAINAVLAGVKEIRDAIATAQEKRSLYSQRTILFVDEVHRFNKAQQDALLPWVETGTVILIGATTENPYFEVNQALVSRSRLFQLKPLEAEDLRQIVQQALTDCDRGYGQRSVCLDADACEHLVNVANGDARALLNALELAVETTLPDSQGQIRLTLTVAEESIQQRAVLYDKEGDAHFDIISAFIKSIRGSDPDAALYWLARMVYAGENPRFIFRRLIILASEDVGLADPQAVTVVTSCADAFDRVGLPEGRYPLAQATLYLATVPKSNSVMGFFDALATVERERELEVPNSLRDGNRDKKGFGHGQGYLYPHAYRDHWVAQQYLPTGLQGQVFYQPSNQGYEDQIRQQVTRQREAQLAALVDGDTSPMEVLTYSPENSAQERWLQRTLSQAGEQVGRWRDRIFASLNLQRHHIVLDLNARTGLLTWEAVRQAPEGGVYACVRTTQDYAALTEQANALPDLARPIVIQTELLHLESALATAGVPNLQGDRIIGRNALGHSADKTAIITLLTTRLAQGGMIVLSEVVPRHSQRRYHLVADTRLNPRLYDRWVEAEEQIYRETTDPLMNWEGADLQTDFEQAGLKVELSSEASSREVYISAHLLSRWFTASGTRDQPLSYRDRLAPYLSVDELTQIQQHCQQILLNQTVQWQTSVILLKAMRV